MTPQEARARLRIALEKYEAARKDYEKITGSHGDFRDRLSVLHSAQHVFIEACRILIPAVCEEKP